MISLVQFKISGNDYQAIRHSSIAIAVTPLSVISCTLAHEKRNQLNKSDSRVFIIIYVPTVFAIYSGIDRLQIARYTPIEFGKLCAQANLYDKSYTYLAYMTVEIQSK